MNQVAVDLQKRSYKVSIEYGLFNDLAVEICALNIGKHCALISDENVAGFYLEKALEILVKAGFTVSSHVVEAGEASKSMRNVEVLCQEMTRSGHGRGSFILALGGGVVGDLAGFVASVFYRGIPFVQVPTSIVAQVDSSVGGKTGVNLAEGKNLVGAFHQPQLVLIDPRVLETLPGREYREGYAEVIKHAAIRDAGMLAELEELDPLNQAPPAGLIARNVAIKARVVEEDEQETSGARALLNFGHTIGHGIEAAVPYGELLHGEAVSLGIKAAVYLSQKKSNLRSEDGKRILNVLEHFSLPLCLADSISTEVVMEKVSRDKKFTNGKVKFILLDRLGSAFVSNEITSEDMREAIEYLRTS